MKQSWQKKTIYGIDCLVPLNIEAMDKLKSLKENQPVTGNMQGSRNESDLKLLGLYWAACSFVAKGSHPKGNYATPKKVDFQVRNVLGLFDHEYWYHAGIDGSRYKLIPINIENINSVAQKAFLYMAEYLGYMKQVGEDDFDVDVEAFIDAVKNEMKGDE